MFQLVYVSTATALVTEGEIARILEASCRNNRQAAVTGLLLYNGRRFMQALEGHRDAVDITYQRIKADPRHRSVSLVASKDLDARMFSDWAMAVNRVSNEANLNDLRAQVDAMTEEWAPSLRAHFLRYAEGLKR